MKKILLALTLVSVLSACNGLPEIAPIPGSLTYQKKSAVKQGEGTAGSTIRHNLRNEYGQPAVETYIIQPDRTLRLVRRDVEGETQTDLFTNRSDR